MAGLALALSSTAVVVPVLAERKRLGSPAGRTAFSVLLFQDLAVAPLLFAVAALAAPGGTSLGSELLFSLGPAALALVGVVVLGRLVLRPLFHAVANTRSTEFFMAICLLVVIGTGAITAASGLSMSLGAFMAGLLLAETEFRREIEVTIEPFKGLLLGLFFVSIGVGLDLEMFFADPWRMLGLLRGPDRAQGARHLRPGRGVPRAPPGCDRDRAVARPKRRIRLRAHRAIGRMPTCCRAPSRMCWSWP